MPLTKIHHIDQKVDTYSIAGKSHVNDDNPDLVYLDVLCTNIQNTKSAPPILTYNEQKSAPFLKNCSDYEMSIVKFQLSSKTLPVIMPIIEQTSTDPNQTIYKITLSYTYSGTLYGQTEYVVYASQISSIPVPTKVANQQQDNTLTYYNIYSYEYWLYLVNNTFTTCFTGLNAQVTTAGGTLPSTHVPFLTFEPTNQLCTLNADYAGYNDASGNYISIHFNLPLFNLFAFPFLVDYSQSLYTARLITNTFQLSNVTQYPPYLPTYDVLQVTEEYVNLSAWCPILSVVVTSNSFPIVSENLPTPTLLYNTNVFSNSSPNCNTDNVITDFTADNGLYTSSFLYVPSGEYRMISFLNTPQDLQTINISVKYLDRFGNYNSVRLNSGGSLFLKILFRKKIFSRMIYINVSIFN